MENQNALYTPAMFSLFGESDDDDDPFTYSRPQADEVNKGSGVSEIATACETPRHVLAVRG